MVKYWKWGGVALAKVTKAPDGSDQMYIEGEDYAYPGFPRGHVLMNPLAKLKHAVKNKIFNDVFAELQIMANDYKYDMAPREKMVPAVREIYDLLEFMEHMEVVDDMKKRISLIKMILTFFLQEDDAYRFRAQYFLSHIKQKKVALSDADKYYARGKYWKVDYDHYDY